jgi:hypothetical protein
MGKSIQRRGENMKCSALRKIVGVNTEAKPLGIVSALTKRSVLAILIALAFGALPPSLSGVRANSCGDLFLFAFPMLPQQGDSITIFVTVVNSTGADQSFVVETKISDPTSKGVGVDDRIVQIPAGSSVSFQVNLNTTVSSRTGTYTIVTQSYQGNTLPVCNNCFCSTTRTQFSLGCNSNDC